MYAHGNTFEKHIQGSEGSAGFPGTIASRVVNRARGPCKMRRGGVSRNSMASMVGLDSRKARDVGNSGMGGGQGANANGNSGTNTNTNTQSQGAGAGEGSGDDAPQYVLKADFDTLTAKLDQVLADNKRYRDERRKARGQNQNGNGGGTGDNSRDDSDNDGTNEMATLRNQLRQANFRTDITTAAIKAGATVPEDIHRLLSIDDSDIDVDDLGYVKNADAVVAELKKTRPAYFGEGKTVFGGADGGSGSNNRQRRTNGNDMNSLLRSTIAARTGRGK